MEIRLDPGRKPRVLIVDDKATYRTVVAEALEQSRLQVRYAADLPEAMGVLKDWKPDVLLLDVMLPGTSGLALLKRLRAVPGWKDLPIVICERSGRKWGPGGRTS